MHGASEFGPDFQRVLVRACVDDPGLRALVQRFTLTGQLGFTDPASGWAWSVISNSPAPTVLQLDTESRRLAPNDPAHGGVFAILNAADFRSSEYVREQIVEWARRQVFHAAMDDAAEAWNRGDKDAAMGLMMKKVEELQQIKLDITDRGWFFEELDERQQRRATVAAGLDYFPSGIEPIDERMHGGLSYGELEIPFAYSGVGKSFFCVQRGAIACRLRRRVLHFVLEGGRKKIENRYDAWFSGELYSHVRRGEISANAMWRMRREFAAYKQGLVLRGFADNKQWKASIYDIVGELATLRNEHGWIPDLIIVDYGDLVHAEGDGEREKQKNAFRQLKALADTEEYPGHRGYAVCAPSQAVRPEKGMDEKVHVLMPRDLADCYEKARIADAVSSINRTNWEKENQRARFCLAKYRDNEDGLLVEIETNYAAGMFALLGRPEPPPLGPRP